MDLDLALIVALIGGYALVAAALDRRSVGPALVFVAIGFLLSGLDVVTVQPRSEIVSLLAETTLALLLFTDASFVRVSALRQDVGMVVRLLAIGLPLTLVFGAFVATSMSPAMPIAVALLVASSLAPTDAALGRPVITDKAVPVRIRRMLNVESGLNDGIVTPFVLVAVALATDPLRGGDDWIAVASLELVIATVVGAVVGGLGGLSLVWADVRGWTTPLSRQLAVLAVAATCYLASLGLDGNGFVAAFVGGLAFGRMSRNSEAGAIELTETVAWTILLSVVLHGLTSGPLARCYGRFVERLPVDAVERASLDELPVGRRSWVHPATGGSPTVEQREAP